MQNTTKSIKIVPSTVIAFQYRCSLQFAYFKTNNITLG